MKNKVFIFDFDGTIADSSFKIYEILNDLAPDYGIERVSDEEIQELRDYSFSEILNKLDIPIYKIPFIYLKFKEEFYKIIKDIKPVTGISDVLNKFEEDKISMHIVSSNTEESIGEFLKNNNMTKYFKLIKGSLLGKDKALRDIIKSEKYNAKEVVYVGDEIRDIDAARKAGIKVVAVTWGFNTKKSLKKESPDYLISSPKELLKV